MFYKLKLLRLKSPLHTNSCLEYFVHANVNTRSDGLNAVMMTQRYNDVTAHRLLPRKVRSFGSNPMKYSCFIGAPAYYNKPSSNIQVSGSSVRYLLMPHEARLTNSCCCVRKLTTYYRPAWCLYNYCFQYLCGFPSNSL